MKKTWITYPLIIGFFGCLIWFIIQKGEALSDAHKAAVKPVLAQVSAGAPAANANASSATSASTSVASVAPAANANATGTPSTTQGVSAANTITPSANTNAASASSANSITPAANTPGTSSTAQSVSSTNTITPSANTNAASASSANSITPAAANTNAASASAATVTPSANTTASSAQPTATTITPTTPAVAKPAPIVLPGFLKNLQNPLGLLLLQIIVIVLVARLAGKLVGRVGQPAVVGEIIAGILLGPSLFGWLAPDVSAFLFPVDSLKSLQFLSQIGLAFFMFIVGMDLDLQKIRNKAHDAVMISHASIIFPFFLGVSLAYFIYAQFAPANISFLAFSLFMGIAMSITAFPVLARIVQERKLNNTPLGTLAITCAAADDITAWCILAAVVAIVKSTGIGNAVLTLIFALGYVALMWYVIRPMLVKIMEANTKKANGAQASIALAFMVLLFSAWMSEIIGIHALFGAFLAGVIMPSLADTRKQLTEKLEDVSVLLLLPIFFVFTGLRTQMGLLTEGHLWTTFGLIMLVAVLGKWGGSTLTAKLVGQSWPDAFSIGALMNTRGLMELVALNIGYDLGILTPEIFTMMVLMALCTTFMTGPLLNAVNRWQRVRQPLMAA